MTEKHVLIAGASGLVGAAAVRRFAGRSGCRVTCLSRRPFDAGEGVEFVSLDLDDRDRVLDEMSRRSGVTDVIYAALHEQDSLIAGWTEQDHVAKNARMLRNLMDAVDANAKGLRHVVLLQGPKAYGVHVDPFAIPAREGRSERRDIPNFYWLQEDYIAGLQRSKSWAYTIFRPAFVVGQSTGGSMNWLAAIGVYAAILKARGEPLHYPGDGRLIKQATDTDLMAAAFEWAQTAPTARNQTFNVANGEVFCFQTYWPQIASALGMKPGEEKPVSLAETMPSLADEWESIRARHGLSAPDMKAFVGQSFQLADFSMGVGARAIREPSILSEVKLREAGFHDVLATDVMFA